MFVISFGSFSVHMLSFLQAVAELGPVDMLVNSAGISFPGEFDNLSVDQFRVSIDLAFHFANTRLAFALLACSSYDFLNVTLKIILL